MTFGLTPTTVSTDYGVFEGFQINESLEKEIIKEFIFLDLVSTQEKSVEKDIQIFRLCTQIIFSTFAADFFDTTKPINVRLILITPPTPLKTDSTARQILKSWVIEFLQINADQPLIAPYEEIFGEENEYKTHIPQKTPFKRRLRNFCYEKLGYISSNLPNTFTDEERKLTKMTETELLINQVRNPLLRPSGLTCHDISLLKAGEEGFLELLIAPTTRVGMLNFLLKWGYKTVQSPQFNDLIIYIKDKIHEHTARYIGMGQVEAKLGHKTRVIHQHPLRLSLTEYGDEILIFRKVEKGTYNLPRK